MQLLIKSGYWWGRGPQGPGREEFDPKTVELNDDQTRIELPTKYRDSSYFLTLVSIADKSIELQTTRGVAVKFGPGLQNEGVDLTQEPLKFILSVNEIAKINEKTMDAGNYWTIQLLE